MIRSHNRCFGTSTVPPQPILKSLPKVFAHTDKTVRAEGSQLTQALYQNIGAAIDPWLADLKPVQVKELHESFADLDKAGNGQGSFKPDRLTRAQKVAADSGALADDVVDQQEQGTRGSDAVHGGLTLDQISHHPILAH